MTPVAYAELRPDQLARRVAQCPLAYLPLGLLEWHSHHLPLGLDGLKAEEICTRAAQRTGGVVLPINYCQSAGISDFPWTIDFPPALVQKLLLAHFRSLERAGFQAIIALSGHSSPVQVLTLFDAAEAYMASGGVLTLGAPEDALADIGGERPGDHAGQWETALLLAMRPDLVALEQLPPAAATGGAGLATPENYRQLGILGQHPKGQATPALGQQVLEHIVEALAQLAPRLLQGDRTVISDLYQRERERLAGIWGPDILDPKRREAAQARFFAALREGGRSGY